MGDAGPRPEGWVPSISPLGGQGRGAGSVSEAKSTRVMSPLGRGWVRQAQCRALQPPRRGPPQPQQGLEAGAWLLPRTRRSEQLCATQEDASLRAPSEHAVARCAPGTGDARALRNNTREIEKTKLRRSSKRNRI